MRTKRVLSATDRKAMIARLSVVNEFHAEYKTKEPANKRAYKFDGTITSDLPNLTIAQIEAAANRAQERIKRAKAFYGNKDLGIVFREAIEANKK